MGSVVGDGDKEFRKGNKSCLLYGTTVHIGTCGWDSYRGAYLVHGPGDWTAMNKKNGGELIRSI